MERPNLRDIKQRVAKATPGPWEAYLSGNDGDGYRVTCVVQEGWGTLITPQQRTSLPYQPDPSTPEERAEQDCISFDDMTFIAAARADVPALIAWIEDELPTGPFAALLRDAERSYSDIARWTSDPRARDEAYRMLARIKAVLRDA